MPDDPQDEVQQPVLIVIRKTPDATVGAQPDVPDAPDAPQTQTTDFLAIVTQAGLTAAGLFSAATGPRLLQTKASRRRIPTRRRV